MLRTFVLVIRICPGFSARECRGGLSKPALSQPKGPPAGAFRAGLKTRPYILTRGKMEGLLAMTGKKGGDCHVLPVWEGLAMT